MVIVITLGKVLKKTAKMSVLMQQGHDLDSSKGVSVEFYGKFPRLDIPNSRLPLEAEAICMEALQHLRGHMIKKGLAKDESWELSAFHLPIFGLFRPAESLWLSPSQVISQQGSKKLKLHFRIRLVWLDDSLESLKPGALHYLYLQCHDDFVSDRIKTMFPTKLEDKSDLVRGMLVMGMVCPQLNCGEPRSERLQDIFTRPLLENPDSSANTSNVTVTTTSMSNGTVVTSCSGRSDLSNGHAGSTSRNELIPQNERVNGAIAQTATKASPQRASRGEKEAERIMKHKFWNLKKRLPASLRGPYSMPWQHYQLYSSIKDHLPKFLQDYQNLTISKLMASYVRGIFNLVPRYGYETYMAKVVKEDNTSEEIHVGLRLINKGHRGLYFGQKFEFALSHFANIKYDETPDEEGEIKVTIQRRVGQNVTLKFDKKEAVESFVSMVQGWYRMEVNFTQSLCTQLSPNSQRLMTALQCFGPMNATVAEELLVKELHQENPPFLICQRMENPRIFRILSLQNKKPVHVASMNVDEAGNHFKVFPPQDTEYGEPLEEFSCANVFDIKGVRPLILKLKERFQLRTYVKQQQCCAGIMHAFVNGHKEQDGFSSEEESISRMQYYTKVPEVFEFASMSIENKLGEGDKTAVEKAKLTHRETQHPSEVALKHLKEVKDSQHLVHLLAAADKMRKLRSESASFINYLGLTTDSSDPFTTYVVLELAPLGNLEHYLKELESPQSLQVTMSLALQVAQAGNFLQQHKIIHGNLRCRNVLIMKKNLSKHWISVKIGDPGLVSIFNKERLSDRYNMERLPWIAGERFGEGNLAKESIATEVFSYGTLLFELVSQAKKKPHETHNISSESPERVKAFYENSVKQPVRPEYITGQVDDDDQIKKVKDSLWNMILKCHHINPSQRPSFEALREELHSLEYRPLVIVPDQPEQTADMVNGPSSERDSSEGQVDNLHVDPDRIKFEEGLKANLGHGHFGVVRLAQLYPPLAKLTDRQEGEGEKVAVKNLKSAFKTQEEINDFDNEVNILMKCSHPNIVKIKAVVSHPEKMLVMEYMEKGSLISFVQREKKESPQKDQEKNKLLYMRICLDVTEGMLFLVSRKIVHRDLAARNVLLTKSLKAKIADFGLSKMFKDQDYYTYAQNSSKELPIFWLAPECLSTPARFSEKSDVWSFGVLMWEVFSGGDHPKKIHEATLGDLPHAFLYRMYEKERRLPRPSHCDLHLYKIMKTCWEMDVKVRSSFEEVKSSLKIWHQSELKERGQDDEGTSGAEASAGGLSG